MKSTTLLAIFSLFIMGIYAASTGAELPIASPTTGIPEALDKKKTSTATPATTSEITESTTSSSTTTQAPTTTTPTTTAAPATTTVAPTTAAPTSTAAPTTSSTATPTTAPTTTTPASKTTTVAPKPVDPKIAKYYVEENNVTCILVEFAVQLNISYGNDQYILYNVPSKDSEKFLKTDGKCGNETTEQELIIIWMENGYDMNTLNLTFNLNNTSNPKEYSLTKAVFNLSSTIVPDNTDRLVLYHVGNFFDTRQYRSYHCGRAQTLNLTKEADAKSKVLGTVTLSHVFMEAYRSTNDQKFSESLDCDAINTPDIVPIAVGIALIALVVVVLIAYLVGRRRAQSRGYVSM